MKLLSVRFLDAVQWKGKAVQEAKVADFPLLRAGGGFVWLSEVTAVPIQNVQQLDAADEFGDLFPYAPPTPPPKGKKR